MTGLTNSTMGDEAGDVSTQSIGETRTGTCMTAATPRQAQNTQSSFGQTFSTASQASTTTSTSHRQAGLDVWSIVDYKSSSTTSSKLRGVCPMSLRFIDCNIPGCSFHNHLCRSFALNGKCATGAKDCNFVHVKPSCHQHIVGQVCTPNASTDGNNHIKVRAHSDAVDFEDRVKIEQCRQWMEGRGYGDPNAL